MNLDNLREAQKEERTRRIALEHDHRALCEAYDVLHACYWAFVRRGFWSRLNWLLTGR